MKEIDDKVVYFINVVNVEVEYQLVTNSMK